MVNKTCLICGESSGNKTMCGECAPHYAHLNLDPHADYGRGDRMQQNPWRDGPHDADTVMRSQPGHTRGRFYGTYGYNEHEPPLPINEWVALIEAEDAVARNRQDRHYNRQAAGAGRYSRSYSTEAEGIAAESSRIEPDLPAANRITGQIAQNPALQREYAGIAAAVLRMYNRTRTARQNRIQDRRNNL